MAVYEYRGINIASGKPVKGVRDADNPKALRAVLRKDGVMLSSAVDGLDLFPPRLLPLAKAMIFAPAWVLAGRSVVIALLAPDLAPLRLIAVSDAGAMAALRLVTAALAVMTVASVAEAAMQSVVAPIAISIAIKGVAALLLAALLVGALWRAARADAAAQ